MLKILVNDRGGGGLIASNTLFHICLRPKLKPLLYSVPSSL